MTERAPERRDVLGALGIGGLGGLLRLVETADVELATTGRSTGQAAPGLVRDATEGRGVSDTEVHGFRMRADAGADEAVAHIGSTVTDEDGRFGVGAEGGIRSDRVSPDDDELVLLLARWQGPPPSSATRRQTEWVGNRTYEPDAFRDATEYEVVLDQRLLFNRTVTDDGDPYGTVTVWDDLDPDVTSSQDEHLIRMEARSVRDPDTNPASASGDDELGPDSALEDETLEEGHLDSGLFSLQLPEHVAHTYRTTYSSDDGDSLPSDPQPSELRWTAAVGAYREDPIEGHVGETSALLAAEGLSVPLFAGLPPRDTPQFQEDYYGPGTFDPDKVLADPPGPWIDDPGEIPLTYFIPYYNGGQQANAEEAQQQALDVASFGLGVISFIPGVGALVSLGLAGASLGVAVLDAATSTPSVPEYARQDERNRIGSGHLEFDLSEYDYVTNGFAYRTYAASQAFDLTGPEADSFDLCARGLFKFDDVGNNETRVVDVEYGFRVDPSVRSPLDDDDGVRIVQGSTDGDSDEETVELRSPLIRGSSSPIIGREATFEAVPQATFESRLFNPVDAVEEYDWTIARRGLDPFEGGRPTGQLIDEEVANGTGRTVSHTFETPGEYTVSVTVTTDDGRTASATRVFEAAEPPLEAVPPVDTDAGEQCVHPTDDETVPATGEDAASFIAPGWCGTWKEYEATPGYEHVVRTRVDGCEDCVLYNASYEIQEPNDGAWQTVRTVTESRGKEFAGDVHELRYRPTSERFRVVNRYDQPDEGRNLGIGFYVTVLAPQLDDGSDDDGTEES